MFLTVKNIFCFCMFNLVRKKYFIYDLICVLPIFQSKKHLEVFSPKSWFLLLDLCMTLSICVLLVSVKFYFFLAQNLKSLIRYIRKVIIYKCLLI